MELLQLKYFVKVIELGGISAAARNFGIPQPSMSQMISRLEKEFGTELFDRVGNRIVPNENGMILYEKVSSALNELNDGILRLHDLNGKPDETIKLIVNACRDTVLDCIFEFSAQNHDARFVVHHHMQDNGRDNPYDLCITSGMLTGANLKHMVISHYDIVIAVYPGHPLYDHTGPVTPDLIKNEEFVLMRPSNDIGRKIREYFVKNGIDPKIKLTCNEPHYLKRCLISKIGLVVTTQNIKDYFPDDIRYLSFDDPTLTQTTRLYWRTDRYMTNTVREFRKTLIENFHKEGFHG